MRIFKKLIRFIWRRLTCRQTYELKAIGLNRDDSHNWYWFECVRCGKSIGITLADVRVLKAKFMEPKGVDT